MNRMSALGPTYEGHFANPPVTAYIYVPTRRQLDFLYLIKTDSVYPAPQVYEQFGGGGFPPQ